MKVSIGIITCKRPDSLVRLLISLSKLVFKNIPEPSIDIIVVDNDPMGEVEKICCYYNKVSKWPIYYYAEPRKGIPYARNKVLDAVSHDAQYLAFIDDDEEASESWIEQLLMVMDEEKTGVVTGPVLSQFSEKVPEWAVRGRFYDRERNPNGELISYARTGNVLIEMRAVETLGLRFDENMAMTGGTDTLFFHIMHKNGIKIAWADNAIVKEWVPRSRVSIKWVLLRAYRTANTQIIFDMVYSNFALVKTKTIFNGVMRIIIGISILPIACIVSLIIGKHIIVKVLRIIFRGAGMLSSSVGAFYHEYKRIHS